MGWTRTTIRPDLFPVAFCKRIERKIDGGLISYAGRQWHCEALDVRMHDRVAICDLGDGAPRVRLLPLGLDLSRPRPADRGPPAIASAAEARAIADDLKLMSAIFGTAIRHDTASGSIQASASRPPATRRRARPG